MTEKMTVIRGPMFAGKTEEILRQLSRAEYAGHQVQVFKPRLDDRWGKVGKIRSHSGGERDAIPVSSPREILELLDEETSLVGISEVQFMDPVGVVEVILKLIEMDVEVVADGLPTDFKRDPFGAMPELLALADEVISLTAICTDKTQGEVCGEEATLTQRFVNGQPAKRTDPVVQVGAEEAYAPRCFKHHKVGR